MDERYEKATKMWLASKIGCDWQKLEHIEFTDYQGGYCETCEYTSAGISYKLGNRFDTYELGYESKKVARFIQEVAEIAADLS